MGQGFRYFVVLAGMRTGSNFLEENLKDYPGLRMFGEVFNPSFVGHKGQQDILGLTLAQREANPIGFLEALREKSQDMIGFRFFQDHDPRILTHVLADRSCAKIILTRNPVESYVSLKIAAKTGQWLLKDARNAKTAKVHFDPADFRTYLAERQTFHLGVLRALQTSGQAAYVLDYEDVRDVDVLNGLARFLGIVARKDAVSTAIKKQNPSTLEDKLVNPSMLEEALARADVFGLSRTAAFEPRRSAVVPNYVAAAKAPLLFMPIRSAPDQSVRQWLAALDAVIEDDLKTEFTQKTLRHWKRHTPGHRSFTVLRHPVARAHAAFVRHILMPGPECYSAIREMLQTRMKLPLPKGAPDEAYEISEHRAAFLGFLGFVQNNLSGQTSVRVDAAWASLEATLRGFGEFSLPDMVLREENLAQGLQQICEQLDLSMPTLEAEPPEGPIALAAIYDDEIEAAARKAYQRDYMLFGYSAWAAD